MYVCDTSCTEQESLLVIHVLVIKIYGTYVCISVYRREMIVTKCVKFNTTDIYYYLSVFFFVFFQDLLHVFCCVILIQYLRFIH